jgi:hypothetical protein
MTDNQPDESAKKKISTFLEDLQAAEKARAILKRFFVSDLLGPGLSLGQFKCQIFACTFSN